MRIAAAAGASGETTFSFSRRRRRERRRGPRPRSILRRPPSRPRRRRRGSPSTSLATRELMRIARERRRSGPGSARRRIPGMGTFGGFAKDGVPRNAGRGGVPEHRSARDLPDPVGDSKRAFSPLSAALRTLPMTPCAVEGVGRGETEGAKISGPGGGGAGTGGGVASRGGRSSSRRAWSRGVARTSCDAYGLNGKCTS